MGLASSLTQMRHKLRLKCDIVLEHFLLIIHWTLVIGGGERESDYLSIIHEHTTVFRFFVLGWSMLITPVPKYSSLNSLTSKFIDFLFFKFIDFLFLKDSQASYFLITLI